jgi:hypothetical protein
VPHELTSVVLPALYTHFNKPENRSRLKVLAEWDRSFEKWFQWEVAFALYDPLMQLGRETWSNERWNMWDLEVKRGKKRVDMVVPFEPPLLLELKVHVPWSFASKWLVGDGDCLQRDIHWIRSVKTQPAAAILLAFEAPGYPILPESLGLPKPVNADPPRIDLGKIWRVNKKAPIGVTARLFAWSNQK